MGGYGGRWGSTPNPGRGHCPLHPFIGLRPKGARVCGRHSALAPATSIVVTGTAVPSRVAQSRLLRFRLQPRFRCPAAGRFAALRQVPTGPRGRASQIFDLSRAIPPFGAELTVRTMRTVSPPARLRPPAPRSLGACPPGEFCFGGVGLVWGAGARWGGAPKPRPPPLRIPFTGQWHYLFRQSWTQIFLLPLSLHISDYGTLSYFLPADILLPVSGMS